jgi:hypothetical protein
MKRRVTIRIGYELDTTLGNDKLRESIETWVRSYFFLPMEFKLDIDVRAVSDKEL